MKASLLPLVFLAPLAGPLTAQERPASAEPEQSAQSWHGAPVLADVRFELERNQIVVPVFMNGSGPYHLLLDTGGNPSAVDLTTAREAGLPLDTTIAGEASGAGGQRIPIHPSRIVDLRLGDHRAGDLDAVALDLGHVSARMGRPIAGVLGYGFLRGRVVVIDYAARRVLLLDGSPVLEDSDHSYSVPLELRSGGIIPLLRAFFVDDRPVVVTLDTGSSLGLELYPWAAAELGLDSTARASGSAIGARGEFEVREGRVDRVRLGPFTASDQVVTLTPEERKEGRPESGNLGNAFLSRFTLVLDYRADRIAFVSPGVVHEARGTGSHVPTESALAVTEISIGTARLGENPLRVRVANRTESPLLAVLDLRAVPGMWMIPNIQRQFPLELPAGGVAVMDAFYEFQRLSPEATLRVSVGRGERLADDRVVLRDLSFQETYAVGADSPDAYDPAAYFTIAYRGPLEIYAWRGSPAERSIDAIAAQRLAAIDAVAELLSVDVPERVRLVFYADEATKLEQTGHRGVGWARGNTVVEVLNEATRLDPYHELAHVVAAAAGSPPPALGEGFAIHASERLGADALRFLGLPDRSVDAAVCELDGTPDYIPLREILMLDNIGSDASSAGREYAEAGSFVKYLIERSGLDRFRVAYRELSEDDDPHRNLDRLARIYDATVEELERAWLDAIAYGCARAGGDTD